ncbi:transcriptional regulator [Rhodohalobacter sp. SW132]|uniref:helix-turn-helix domain-containing protein n=1 Tax=Rhodohalobacter sp. SW132 TaxID=2293433 RepID=UPI000E289D74|nr:helix-turn-helix domain-containing protein [Rhodohalobacter sp. SW132]REL37907.1 transcriptional regulator [Rhodohalobacter sp. SW132]
MNKKRPFLLPKHERMLQQVGEQLKLARLRRRLSVEQVSQRADIGTSTLWRIEKGEPGVAMGNYFMVLVPLELDKDILKLALDDELGRKLQDAGLTTKKRAPKRESSS